MNGLMMNQQLSISTIVEHAERVNGSGEIVSITADNPRHRYTYREAFARARQLADSIARWELAPGDRIATLAWNDYRHFETYYAAACSGYVCHTINPRLFPEQLAYIINHADDKYVFLDPDFVPLAEGLADQCPGVQGWVVLTTAAAHAQHQPVQRVLLRDAAGRGQRELCSGRSSMKTPPARCAIPPAPPAIPRAYCIRTAPRCCTPTPR